jgi:hypothetical protein
MMGFTVGVFKGVWSGLKCLEDEDNFEHVDRGRSPYLSPSAEELSHGGYLYLPLRGAHAALHH